MISPLTIWGDRVITNAFDGDYYKIAVLKYYGVRVVESAVIGCAIVGAIDIGVKIVKSFKKK